MTIVRRSIALAAAAAVFAAGAAAATGWHVFATGQDSGTYGAFALASADVLKPHALAVRASKEADVSWTLICDGKTHARANQVVAVAISAAGSCHLSGDANTSGSGTVRLQLLRK